MADFNIADTLGIVGDGKTMNSDQIEALIGGEETPEEIVTPEAGAEGQDDKDTKDKPFIEDAPSPLLSSDDIEDLIGADEKPKDKDEDKEDKPEESKEPIEKQEETEEEEPESNRIEAASKWLTEIGVLSALEEGQELPQNEEELAELIRKNKEKEVREILSSAVTTSQGEDGPTLFDALFVKKVDPREYLSIHNEILDLNDLDLTDEETQEQIVAEAYRRMGDSNDRIQKKISRLKEYKDLEEEAQSLHQRLIAQDKKKMEDMVAKKAAEDEAKILEANQYRQKITSLVEEKTKTKNYDGIPVTDVAKEKAIKALTEPAYRLKNGETITSFEHFLLYELKNPANYELAIKLALLQQNNFDLSKIKQSAGSQQANKLFQEITKQKPKKQNTTTKPLSWF